MEWNANLSQELRLGILGGCFNPVHCGHMRLAIEVREALGLDRVELVPTARPPHKADLPILDFGLRCELLRLACSGLDWLGVNELEARRPGPSYTFDTLEQYQKDYPRARRYFILGVTDLLNLGHWKRGLELGTLAGLGVVSREGLGLAEVEEFVQANQETLGASRAAPGLWNLPSGNSLHYMEIPALGVSASLVRERWKKGRSLKFLVPYMVEKWIAEHAREFGLAVGGREES